MKKFLFGLLFILLVVAAHKATAQNIRVHRVTSTVLINADYTTASRCARFDANKNLVAATGDCASGDTGGGGIGTVGTTTRFISGEITIAGPTSTVFTTSSFKVTTNTTPFLFEVYGLASSTELRVASATFQEALRVTNGGFFLIQGETNCWYLDNTFASRSACIVSDGIDTITLQGSGANETVLVIPASNRTFAFPNIAFVSAATTGTLAVINATQTFTGTQTFTHPIIFGSASGTNITVTGYGTFPTLNFTNSSGTNLTAATYLQSATGILTNVSSSRLTATTLVDTARTVSPSVSSTNLDVGTLTGPLFGDNGRVKASVSASGTLDLLAWNTLADTSGDVFFDTTADHFTNDLASHGVWAFNSATGTAPTTKMCLSDVFKVPYDYASTTAPRYVIEWTATSTTGVVVWDIDVRVVTSTASLDQSTFNEAVTASSSNPTAVNLRTTTTVTSTASIYSPGDLAMYSLCRDGADSTDTGVGRTFLHHAWFEYTKQ